MAEEVVAVHIKETGFKLLADQETVWNRLVKVKSNNRIATAYLFHGSSGCGKEGYAIKLAALLNCKNSDTNACGDCSSCRNIIKFQHGNLTLIIPYPRNKTITKNDPAEKALSGNSMKQLHELKKEKSKNLYIKLLLSRANRILINSIRDLRKSIYLSSIEGGQKVVLIFDAHLLSAGQGEAGNALLKMLEEPPSNTTFILTTDHLDQLMQTIQSRCQKILFNSIPEHVLSQWLKEMTDKNEDEIKMITQLSQGNVRLSLELTNESIETFSSSLRSLVKWVSIQSENNWRQFINHGSSLNRSNPEEFKFQLKLLSCWFRDVYCIRNFNGQANLILPGLKSEMVSYAEKFGSGNFLHIISEIEMCSDSLKRNLNVNLVLINLLMNIRDQLKLKTSYSI